MNENNNNRLNQLFDSRDWSAVIAHLHTDEGRLQAAQRDPTLLIHRSELYNNEDLTNSPPLQVLEALIEAYPEGLELENVIPNGVSCPLQIALKAGAHTSVVQLLLRSNPALAQRILGTERGARGIPLYWAIKNYLTYDNNRIGQDIMYHSLIEHSGPLSLDVGYVLPVPIFGYDYHPCRALALACGLPGGALNETALLCILRVDVTTAQLQDENTGELALHVLCKFAMNYSNRDCEQFANPDNQSLIRARSDEEIELSRVAARSRDKAIRMLDALLLAYPQGRHVTNRNGLSPIDVARDNDFNSTRFLQVLQPNYPDTAANN